MNHINIPWGLIIFLVGIAYGYFSPGRTDKSALFRRALLWGLIIGVVLALLGWLLGVGPLGFGLIALGVAGIVISVAILTLFFLVGTWIGDWLEHRRHGGPRTSMRRVD